MKAKTIKIALIGGHLTPALAVADELLSLGYNNLIWIGVKKSQTADTRLSAEYKIVTQKAIKFINFKAGKLWLKWTPATFFKALYNLILIPVGFIWALIVVIKHRPSVIMSFGGFLALPLAFAGKLSGAQLFTHEQTAAAGLTNRIIARICDKVFISWESSAAYFPKAKTIITGNPIRAEVLKQTTHNYVFSEKLPVVYITGGNQGANTINWRIAKVISLILKQANVIHQTGSSGLTNDFKNAHESRQNLPEELRKRYIIKEHIFGEEIGEVFAKADLVVSRSGANTISELLALQKPSLLIPIPWSSGAEQLKNAQLVANTGLAKILLQYDDMQPKELLDNILDCLEHIKKNKGFNGEKLDDCKIKALKLIKTNAAAKIASYITA